MGEVHLALDTRLDRKVALKLLPSRFSGDENRRRRFEREARAASALNHPNIVQVYDVGEEEGTPFIVMEYVEGRDLGAVLSERRVSVDEALGIAAQVADALDEANGRQISHRDIKPANIMITPRGTVKVLDFGIAKLASATGDSTEALLDAETETTEGGLVGTVRYMSPEQALGHRVDTRSDIFSLGVVLYEMLTGKAPFLGASAVETIDRILHAEPEAPSRIDEPVPEGLEAVLRRCLAKDPDRRYRTPGGLRADLEGLRRGRAPRAAAASPRGGRRALSRGLAAAAAAVLVVAAVVTLLQVLRPAEASIRAIAVLPFENATGDPEVDYLSDGISESLIRSLARLPDLRVTSRTSAFALRDRREDLEAVGRQLGVEAVLLGRLAQRGDSITISAELVDVSDRHQLWGDRYERPSEALLSIEQEIATTIALRVRSELSSEEAGTLLGRQEVDPQAYRLYLRGRQYIVGTYEEMGRAVEYLQKAIEREPNYALAHAGLAEAYVLQGYLLARDREEAARLARPLALRALELDPSLSEAHTVTGMIAYYFDWDWETAERELRRAVDLNPGNAGAYEEYSNFLMSVGREREAIETARLGAEFDPLSVLPVHQLGIAYMVAGEYERAAEQFLRAQELRPGWVWGHIKRGKALSHLGRCAEALEEAARGEEILAGEGLFSWSWLGFIYARCGEEERAREALDRLAGLEAERHVDPTALAVIHAALGDEEKVAELLEAAYAERSPLAVYTGMFPEFYDIPGLRENPRYRDLLEKLELDAL